LTTQRQAPPGRSGDWLLADVGGTNVRFALARPAAAAPLRLDTLRAYRVADHPSLSAAARTYLHDLAEFAPEPATPPPAHAMLALAGRIEGDTAQLTNHSWLIHAPRLRDDLGLDAVRLVNDFTAVGMSLPLLGAADVEPIGPAVQPLTRAVRSRTFCVLGPGTGLGVSALVVRGDQVVGLQTEGGHTAFAPADEEQIAVLRQLMARFGRVSVERLLCGSGLVNLLQACAPSPAARRLPMRPRRSPRAPATAAMRCACAPWNCSASSWARWPATTPSPMAPGMACIWPAACSARSRHGSAAAVFANASKARDASPRPWRGCRSRSSRIHSLDCSARPPVP